MEDEELLLALLVAMEHDNATPPPFRDLLDVNQRRLRSAKCRRGSLFPPSESAFMRLYNSGQDDALVTICGFNHDSFSKLLDLFDPLFHKYTPYSSDGLIKEKRVTLCQRGRPRLLTSIICLGLTLAWTRTRGSYGVLQVLFGLTPNPLSMWLRFGRRIVV